MPVDAASPRRVPILACDGFMLAMDRMMRRTGQGPHLGAAVLEFDQPVEVAALREGWARFVGDHAMILARLVRAWPGAVPHWRVPPAVGAQDVPPIGVWRERGAPGAEANDAQVIDSLAALCRTRLRGGIDANVQLDAIERADGRGALLMTWSHLLLDAKGAEGVLTELAERCADSSASPSMDTLEPTPLPQSVAERRRRRIRFIRHFRRVMRTPITSLAGPDAHGDPARVQVLALDREASEQVRDRASTYANKLIPAPFYLACAARAHARVLGGRGGRRPQVVTLPIQMRPKGGAATGPLFQNHLSMLFFHLSPEQLDSLAAATNAIQAQFTECMRDRLDLAFLTMQSAMRRVPPRLYLGFLRWHARGELASFFHSHTGPFAPRLARLAGATVENAYHLPIVCAPPGTGLFLGEHDARLHVALCWRGELIDADQRCEMLEQFATDLTGDAATPLESLLEV